MRARGLLLVVLVAFVALSGCSFLATSKPQGHAKRCRDGNAGIVIDTAVIVSAVALDLVLVQSCEGSGCDGVALVAAGLTIIAIPSLIGVLYGATTPSCAKHVTETAEQRRDRRLYEATLLEQRSRQQKIDQANQARMNVQARARTIMNTAAAAARSGDCETVKVLHFQVKNLDLDFHAKVFARDVGIARCLALADGAPP